MSWLDSPSTLRPVFVADATVDVDIVDVFRAKTERISARFVHCELLSALVRCRCLWARSNRNAIT